MNLDAGIQQGTPHMKAITITQPWATLIAIGAKKIETRSWWTGYRGPLAIHAGAGLEHIGGKRGLAELLLTEPFLSVLAESGVHGIDDLPFGCIVAVGELVAVFHAGTVDDRGMQISAKEWIFGNFGSGRYGWRLENVHKMAKPITTRGALGLWDWSQPASQQQG